MRILIDADGCPVVDIAIACAKPKGIPVLLVCDTAHFYERDGAQTMTVDKGADSADFRLVNLIEKGDIVVTQDYGLAAMALARNAIVLNQDGMAYTGANIDSLLLARHTARKIRMGGGRLKGPPKRTREQDGTFREALQTMLREASR
ncbi:MAG: YaiI/YqxD family protein [Eubacteriales bacterium]|nr:YaiI/YqxD family protein [Eubacteriales bacterium]